MPRLDQRQHFLFINRRKHDDKGRKLIETVAKANKKAEALKLLQEWQSKGHQSHYYLSPKPAKINYCVLPDNTN